MTSEPTSPRYTSALAQAERYALDAVLHSDDKPAVRDVVRAIERCDPAEALYIARGVAKREPNNWRVADLVGVLDSMLDSMLEGGE